MSTGIDPFAGLKVKYAPIQPGQDINPSPDEDSLESEKWEAKGRKGKQHKEISKYINPFEGQQMPKKGLDIFEGLQVKHPVSGNVPITSAEAPTSTPQNMENPVSTFLGDMPPIGSEAYKEISSPKTISEMIDIAAGSPGIKMVGQFGANVAKGAYGTAKDALRSVTPFEQEAIEAQRVAEEARAVKESSSKIRPGEISTLSEKTPIQEVEDLLGRHLKIESPHAMRVSQSLKERISSINDYWGNRYSDLMGKLRSSKFQMPQETLEELNINDIYKQAQQGKLTGSKLLKAAAPEESPFFTDLIARAPKSTDTSAADFISKYKDFRNGIYELRQMAKSTPDEALRRQLFKDVNRLEGMESTVKSALEKGLGEHATEFKEINKGYSDQVFPLRSNATAKKIMKGAPMSENIIKELSNDKEGTALIKEIAKQDPEIVKSILGQRYRAKPSDLHNPNELMREYLDESPEIKKLLTNKENTLRKISDDAKTSLENKVKSEAKLDQIKKSKKSAWKKITVGAGLGGAFYGAKKGMSILNSLLDRSNSGEE